MISSAVPWNRRVWILVGAALLGVAGCSWSTRGKPSPSPTEAIAATRGYYESAIAREPDAGAPARHHPAAHGPRPGDIPAPDDVAAPPVDAIVTKSGLASVVLMPGNGKDKPKYDPNKASIDQPQVRVHYTGWTRDGRMFDSSVARGEPATFRLGQVIEGWNEVLQLMTVGEKRRVWIPASLAYGEHPAQPGAPAGPLTFDIELLDIEQPGK